MSIREKPPRNVERALWAECMGHCMNPVCQTELIRNGTNIGEMAHIKPNSIGGNVGFENLIMLCCNCHTEVDSSRTEMSECVLKDWKSQRNQEIRKLFAVNCNSFEQLTQAVLPILRRNGQIFESYGPAGDESYGEGRRELWLKFENELIANNERLGLLLERNRSLLHKENREIVDEFLSHKLEFERTRNSDPASREKLFPVRLLSIFGLESVEEIIPQNVSAIQNLVSLLIDNDSFVELVLLPCQVLTYRVQDHELSIDLTDRPRVQQILYNERCYRPRTTNLRLGNLVFFLSWLDNNNIEYEFPDIRDLTRLILNNKYKLKLYYEYVLSLSALQETRIESGLIVVNLHSWNDGPISADAFDYATEVGLKVFSQNEFFIFAHKRVK